MDPTNQNPPLSKEELMERELSNLESEGGITYDKPETIEKVTSLGKASTSTTTTMAGESGWKLVKLDNLPSKGLAYHDNFELLIRSAKTKEIRHWSTIDEYDPIDVS